ncbi:MAG: hypothetical protein H7222_17260 [Methylotenera sp.]|nr:hypothetical protein [Oligoflexia bacterium]
MTMREIERIQSALNAGIATTQDFNATMDEAVRYHHKVSELQMMLLVIQKKCEMELQDLENDKPVTQMHYALMLDYLMDVLSDCRHIKAA